VNAEMIFYFLCLIAYLFLFISFSIFFILFFIKKIK